MVSRPRNGDVDEQGRLFCDGCNEWLDPASLQRPDNGHRVGPPARSGVSLPMRDDSEDPPTPVRDPIVEAYRAMGGRFL